MLRNIRVRFFLNKIIKNYETFNNTEIFTSGIGEKIFFDFPDTELMFTTILFSKKNLTIITLRYVTTRYGKNMHPLARL